MESVAAVYTQLPAPPPSGTAARPRRAQGVELVVVLCLLLVSGAANFVLLKVLFAAYGEHFSFFVSQGINILYCVYGGLLVYPRMLPHGVGNWVSCLFGFERITQKMRAPVHQRHFFAMGVMDCFGTFFTAMGAVYTPGQYQTLLNQSLIPATMLASAIFLQERYSLLQLGAALLIVGGAVISIGPSLLPGSEAATARADDEVRMYAVLIYWLSNVPMACSAVYKEARFSCEPMDVCYLTQWVSIWQMLFGFVLAPLQIMPGVGSAKGVTWGEICDSFVDGTLCFFEGDAAGACRRRHAFLLMCSYVAVNFFFNTLGLWLTKHAGAVLNSISFALLLPLTTIAFSLPFLGRYQESAHAATYVGLVVVLGGFALWRYCQLQEEEVAADRKPAPLSRWSPRDRPDTKVPLRSTESVTQSLPSGTGLAFASTERLQGVGSAMSERDTESSGALTVLSFQERVVGMGRVGHHRDRCHSV